MRGERWDVEFVEALYELKVDSEGLDPNRLTQPDETATSASFSTDGALIAYLSTVEDGTFPHHSQIAVNQPDGSARRVLTASLDPQCAPSPLGPDPARAGG